MTVVGQFAGSGGLIPVGQVCRDATPKAQFVVKIYLTKEASGDTLGYVIHLHAFFDDAGTDGSSKFTACGGYLSTARRWRAFERKWAHLLRSYHIPADKFSMKKFAQSAGPFRGWGEDEFKRRAFLSNALNIVQRCVHHGFVSILVNAEYDAYLSSGVKNRVGGYYPFCGEMCVGLVERYIAERESRDLLDLPKSEIDYVFESGTHAAGKVQTAFEEYWGDPYVWHRHFRFEDKNVLELHAADILAYEACKNRRDAAAGKSTLRHPYSTLIYGIPHHFLEPRREQLLEINAELHAQNWIA